MVRGNNKWKGSVARLGGLRWPQCKSVRCVMPGTLQNSRAHARTRERKDLLHMAKHSFSRESELSTWTRTDDSIPAWICVSLYQPGNTCELFITFADHVLNGSTHLVQIQPLAKRLLKSGAANLTHLSAADETPIMFVILSFVSYLSGLLCYRISHLSQLRSHLSHL